MKKILIVLLSALIFLSSCSMNNDVPTKGELLITINSSLSRSITSGESISANVAKYKIYVFDKEYSAPYITEYLDKNEENQSIKLELQSGDNWVRVYALNELGDSIATDIQKITIQPGKLTNLNFSLTEANIEGSITINIQVPSDKFLYAKIFKISDKNSLIDTDITANLNDKQNFIQITNSEIKILKTEELLQKGLPGGFYSVRFYSSDNTESYLSSIPVRVIGSNSYVAGTYDGEKIEYRPYIYVNFNGEVASESSIYMNIDSFSEIQKCSLNYIDGNNINLEGNISLISTEGTNKRYSIVFNEFDNDGTLSNSWISMKLSYTVDGEDYEYNLGDIFVNVDSPITLSFNTSSSTNNFAVGQRVGVSVNKENSEYDWYNNYKFTWYIDGKEYYYVNNPSVHIDTSKLSKGEHKLELVATNINSNIQKKASIIFKLDEEKINTEDVNVRTSSNKFEYSSSCITPVKLYLVDSNEKELLLGIVNSSSQGELNIPEGFKLGTEYKLKIVPIVNDLEQNNKRLIIEKFDTNFKLIDLVSFELSIPKKGVFTNEKDNLPVITINGLEYLDIDKYQLRLLTNRHEYVDNEFSKIQLKGNKIELSPNQINHYQNNNINYISIELITKPEFDFDNLIYDFNYIYNEQGLQPNSMDKVYQAYVVDQNAKAEYRTLMLDETNKTYLYFVSSVSGINEHYLALGSGSYELNNNKFTIEAVKVANGIDTINVNVDLSDGCTIDDIKYTLLSSDVAVPNEDNKLEGAWKLNDIEIDSELLNDIAIKYQNVLKLPEGYLKFNEDDFVKVDVIASIVNNQFKLAISLNLDADVFGSISLADNFTPYIVLEGEIIDGKILKIGDVNVPISLSTTKDGKVLNIFYYLSYLKNSPLSISMVRTDKFELPNSSISGTYFESVKKLDFDSVYDFAKSFVNAFPASTELLKQIDIPVILKDEDGNPMPINNSWEVKSEDIKSLNNCTFTSIMGMLLVNDINGNYLFGYTSNNPKDTSNQIMLYKVSNDNYNNKSYVLQINKLIEIYDDKIVFDVSYFAESSSEIENGVIVLERKTNNLIDTFNNCFMNNLPIDICEVRFKTNGEIDFVLTGLSNLSVTIGKYSLSDNMIDINVDSDILFAAGIDTKNIKVSVGLILSLVNDEIMILEDINQEINFGFKLK